MRSAYLRHPQACLLHGLGLIILMTVYQQGQMPLHLSIPAYLLLALWPWFGPWQRPAEDAPPPDAALAAFSALRQSLARSTDDNALVAAQQAVAVAQLADQLHVQLQVLADLRGAAKTLGDSELPSAQRAEQGLAELAATDSLTGLANRRQLDQVLRREWARAQRSQRPLAARDRRSHLPQDLSARTSTPY